MAKRKSSDSGALDPALTQKKRARRRLVGAIALGVLAAIVLPLLLDSEPRQTISDVQVEIPPRDAPSPPTAAQPLAVPPLAAGEAPADGKAEISGRNAIVPPAEHSGAGAAASASAATAAASSSAHAGAASRGDAAPAGARRGDAGSAQRDDSARREGPDREASNRDAARREAPGREAASRDASNRAASSREASSRETSNRDTSNRDAARGAEVKPRQADTKPAAEPRPATETKAEATRFVLQLGAYANPASAKAQAEKAGKAGVRAYTETVQTAQGARTRVRVGPFNSREAAEQSRARLKNGGVDASVVSL